jgi:hypothetical protein
MWKNSLQIKEELSSTFEMTGDSRLERFHLATILLNGSILTEQFAVTDQFEKAIVPSKYFYKVVREVYPDLLAESQAIQKLVALQVFYFHDALIDFARSDDESIRRFFSKQIIEGSILLPSRCGRVTYDKFNRDFSRFARDRASHLAHDQTLDLLRNTEQGIYQVGRFTLGPLGVFSAEERRMLPVVREIPLWHCADTGCNALHHVELRSWQHNFLLQAGQLRAALIDQYGRPSEWQLPFRFASVPSSSVHHGTAFYDLPVLLAETFDEGDIGRLFERAVRSADRERFAARIEEADVPPNWARASPAMIAEQCERNAKIQLLSSLKATRLVELIDGAIEQNEISIPLNEVRRAVTIAPKIRRSDPSTVISSLGVRAERRSPTTFMAEAIWKAYDEQGLLSDLEWRCRRASGSANLSAPIDFIRSNDPSSVIRELVLTSREVTTRVAEYLGLPLGGFDDQGLLVERFLWKFGFSRPRYDDRLERIQKQIIAFRTEILKSSEHMREEDRDRIRSKGVNLFVNLEAFLEEMVSYNCWIFWSDHFVDTKFGYRKSDGLALVARILGSSIATPEGELRWKVGGGNTLGTLLAYANKLAKEMSKLPLADRAPLTRPIEDLPHFFDASRFIFCHTQLWADLSEIETKKYAEKFSSVVDMFLRSQIASVRNGLDHFREADLFPKLEIMTNFATFADQALEVAEINRFFPVALWLKRVSEDEMGRKEYVLEDYRGRSVLIYGPSLILGIKEVKFGISYLIPSFNLTGYSNADLPFEIREASSFTAIWDGYPIRQRWKAETSSAADEDEEPILDSQLDEISDV